jgi:hypothetical protein
MAEPLTDVVTSPRRAAARILSATYLCSGSRSTVELPRTDVAATLSGFLFLLVAEPFLSSLHSYRLVPTSELALSALTMIFSRADRCIS